MTANQLNPNGTPQTSRWYDQVRAFTEAMGQPVDLPLNALEKAAMPCILEDGTVDFSLWDSIAKEKDIDEGLLKLLADQATLRFNLIDEELYEVRNAPSNEEMTKELADLLYVTIGFAVTFGLPIVEVFERVHQSNMSKLDDNGKPLYREDGKVMKGPNYQPPELRDLF